MILVAVAFAYVGFVCTPGLVEMVRVVRTAATQPKHVIVMELACQHLERVDAADPSTFSHIDEAAKATLVAAGEAPKWRPIRDEVKALKEAKGSPTFAEDVATAVSHCDSGIRDDPGRPILPPEE